MNGKMLEYDRFCISSYNHPRRGILWSWSPRKGTMADGRAVYAVSNAHGGFTTYRAAYDNAIATTARED